MAYKPTYYTSKKIMIPVVIYVNIPDAIRSHSDDDWETTFKKKEWRTRLINKYLDDKLKDIEYTVDVNNILNI